VSRFGISKMDISPPLGMPFIGYSRPDGISEVHDPLYVTACVFESEKAKSVFVSIDNIGMLVEDTNLIREGMGKRLDMSEEKITVVFSHTHSGPATASTDSLVLAYKTLLIQQTVEAVVKANDNLENAEVGWHVTDGKIGVNRREKTTEGYAKMGTDPAGIVDERIGTLLIRDPSAKHLIGALIFCTAHPNVLKSDSISLSGDYPGIARKILEQSLSCPVVIIQGAAGNVNAKYRGDQASLKKMAYALIGNILTMVPEVTFHPIFKHSVQSVSYPMRLDDVPNPTDIESMASRAEVDWNVSPKRWRDYMVERWERRSTTIVMDIEVQLFQLNEGSFAGIQMEPFCESALFIRQSRQDDLAFFGGYTNGYIGYLPTEEEYPYGGYEVTINPVVYGPVTGLWMPPVSSTATEITKTILELYHT